MTRLFAGCRWGLRHGRPRVWPATVLCVALVSGGIAARADDSQPVTQADLQKLMQDLDLQKKKLAAQEQALAEQQRVIANQQNQLNFLKGQVGLPDDPELVPVAYNLGNAVPSGTVAGVLQAQEKTTSGDEKPVGTAPEQSRPQIAILQEEGGVLTRKGQIILEPSLEYTHSSQDRFFFQGFEVIDTVLIGLIEATKADRNTVEAALGVRVGVTDRLELEARIPYIYRSDHVQNTNVTQLQLPTIESNTTGSGLGDVEIAAHYDFTNLIFDAPFKVYTVANLRVKTPTGEGPFDVPFDTNGEPKRLSTGSGFWGVQPSFTAIFPTDPVVFFGTVGYTANIGENVNKTNHVVQTCPNPPDPTNPCVPFDSLHIGDVDPGDSVNTSVGMGLSLNERTSVSFGFQFDYVFPTTQEASTTDTSTDPDTTLTSKAKSDPLYIGSFVFGWSYQISDNVGLNLNFQVGATDNAPDFVTTLRVPIRFDVF
jgi:hypothetical protein